MLAHADFHPTFDLVLCPATGDCTVASSPKGSSSNVSSSVSVNLLRLGPAPLLSLLGKLGEGGADVDGTRFNRPRALAGEPIFIADRTQPTSRWIKHRQQFIANEVQAITKTCRFFLLLLGWSLSYSAVRNLSHNLFLLKSD